MPANENNIHFSKIQSLTGFALSLCPFSCHGNCRKKQLHHGAPGKKSITPSKRKHFILRS